MKATSLNRPPKDVVEMLLELIRLGIHTSAEVRDISLVSSVDWSAVFSLAVKHSMVGVAWDGYERLQKEGKQPSAMIPKDLLKNWFGTVAYSYEQRYVKYAKVLENLAKFYDDAGYRMMILKGYGLSLDYPKPNHRPCGDIDIWLFGEHESADKLLEGKGIKIDKSHHHHNVFKVGGEVVENHYDFINVHAQLSNRKIEDMLKKIAYESFLETTLGQQKIFLPSPDFNAIFLLRHMSRHFAAAEVSIRHLLDWGTFMERHSENVNWEKILPFIRETRMEDIFSIFNSICIDYLGFDKAHFPSVTSDSELEARVFGDVISPEFADIKNDGVLNGLKFRWNRWRANKWKQQLVYSENRISAFFVQIWSHMLKPASIKE